MNWESERAMARDVAENPELYEALAGDREDDGDRENHDCDNDSSG